MTVHSTDNRVTLGKVDKQIPQFTSRLAVLRAGCIMAAVAIAIAAQLSLTSSNLGHVAAAYGLSVILLAIGLWRQPRTRVEDFVPGMAAEKLGDREVVLRGALVFLGIALSSYASYLLAKDVLGPYQKYSLETAVILYGAGIAALVSSFSLIDNREWAIHRRFLLTITKTVGWVFDHKLEIASVLFALGLALGLRVYQLDAYPPGLGGDEGIAGNEAVSILEDLGHRPIYNALSYYVIAGAFQLFGQSIIVARLTTVALGVVTVLFLYLLVRMHLGPRFAFLGAILLATSRWHINQSRSMLDLAYVPLFEIAAIYFLLKGMRGGRLPNFIWSALAIILGLYCYVAFRAVPIIIIAFLLCKLVLDRQTIIRNVRGLGVFFVALIILGAPFWVILFSNQQLAAGRPSDVFIFNNKAHESVEDRSDVEILLGNARKVYLQFNYSGDPNGMSNIPRFPMLDLWSGALFVLGIAIATVFWWRGENLLWMLLFWCTTFLGGVLTIDQPHSGRIIAVIPILVILIVGMLHQAWISLSMVLGERGRVPLYGLVALPVVFASFQNYDVFFNQQISERGVYAGWAPYITSTGQLAAEMGEGATVYLLGSFYFGHPPFQFAGQKPDGRDSFALADSLPPTTVGDGGVGYVANGPYIPLLKAVQAYYPDGTGKVSLDRYGGTMAASYYLPKDLVEKNAGLQGRYFANPEWQGEPTLVRIDSDVDFTWSQSRPMPGAFSVEWAGAIVVPKPGDYTIGVRSNGLTEMIIDNNVTMTQPGGQGLREVKTRMILAEGLHSVLIRSAFASSPLASVNSTPAIGLMWESQTAGFGWQVIPGKALVSIPNVYGLTGIYHSGSGPEGKEIRRRVDPMLWFHWRNDPVPKGEQERFHVEWKGFLQIAEPGRYSLDAISDGRSNLQIDGRSQAWRAPLALDSGQHPIKIEYFSDHPHGWFELYWTPPRGEKEIVPPTALSPMADVVTMGADGQSSPAVTGNPTIGNPVDSVGEPESQENALLRRRIAELETQVANLEARISRTGQ